MQQPVDVSIHLSRRQAKALLQLQELWWAEEFRCIPEGLRHGSIIAARPAMAAQRATLGALKCALFSNRTA